MLYVLRMRVHAYFERKVNKTKVKSVKPGRLLKRQFLFNRKLLHRTVGLLRRKTMYDVIQRSSTFDQSAVSGGLVTRAYLTVVILV